jgi:nonsense-mediated mRNA decay protein 3
VKTSKKLIGTDDKSNISNYKYTNFVEICPLCKDDLCYLPLKLARKIGNMPQLVLVKNISSLIHFLDPLSGQTASINADQFWRDPIRPIVTAARNRMTRFVVLGKEPIVLERNVSRRTPTRKQKNCLANLTLAREDDLGVNDQQLEERSHVGYLMKAGDVCVGYDLTETQVVDDEADDKRAKGRIPDVVVLRKLYGGVATGEADAARKRMWKLKRLEVKQGESTTNARSAKNDAETDDMDEEDFMREVEADKEMRSQMNLYKSDVAAKVESASMEELAGDDDDDEDDQEIKLDELLDGLALDAGPDDEDEDEEQGVAHHQGPLAEGDRANKDGIKYVGREDARQIRVKDVAVPLTEFGKEFSVDDPDL